MTFLKTSNPTIHNERCLNCSDKIVKVCNHLLIDENAMELIIYCKGQFKTRKAKVNIIGCKMHLYAFPTTYSYGQPGCPVVTFGVILEDNSYYHLFDPAVYEDRILNFLNGGQEEDWKRYASDYMFLDITQDILSQCRKLARQKFHDYLLNQLSDDLNKFT